MRQEFLHLLISVAAVTLIFAFPSLDPNTLLISLLLVGLAFVCHELAHRAVARHFGYAACYRMFPTGLMLSVALTVLTQGYIKFLMPGAVMVYPRLLLRQAYPSKQELGLIAFAGPMANLVIAALCKLLAWQLPNFAGLLELAAALNAWLAFFNLIPFGPLDGTKAMLWNWKVWLLGMLSSAVLLYL